MNPRLQRVSLVDQVVSILREGITTARWRNELPSERTLCRDLQVSRVTLRKALAQLIRERWIATGGRGCQHRVVRKSAGLARAAGRTIRVLSPASSFLFGSLQSVAFETLAERVSAEGYRLEIEHRPQLFQRHEPDGLRRLEALPDTAGWILIYSTKPMQHWFEKSGWPCVVLGPLYEGVTLSCVYPDMRAVARHMVGRLSARGHRNLVFLSFKDNSLGGRQAEETFIAEAGRLGIYARLVVHEDNGPALRETVGRLLDELPRPDAFVSVHVGHAITVLCGLHAAGVRVPDEAAVVSCWDDVLLEFTTPPMTRYRIDGVELGRRLAKLFLDLLKHGPGKIRKLPILPEFIPGGTLALK